MTGPALLFSKSPAISGQLTSKTPESVVILSRAGFLKICGTVVLGRSADGSSLFTGALAFISADAAPRAATRTFEMEEAGAALFRPHLNTAFDLRSHTGLRLRLRLVQITPGPLNREVEQFSLTFHGSHSAMAAQGTYQFRHPALGTFDLFIAPIGSATAQRTLYEACFSRHLGPRERTARQDCAPGGPGGDVACQTHS
jgi:hypothetical protein